MMTQDAIDELAALFLTPGLEPSEPEAMHGCAETGVARDSHRRGNDAATPTLFEIVLVGHLPVRAGVWLGPYADAVARERGCAALVRLDRGEPFVQVMRGADAPAGPAAGTMRELIASLAPHVQTWLLRPPHEAAVDDLAALDADRITILSSADGAAVVAAYQLIKELAASASARGAATPPIGIAVMGADEEQAERVVRRINQAAAAFLDTSVELTLCLPRMDSDIHCTREAQPANEAGAGAAQVAQWIAEAAAVRAPQVVKTTPSVRSDGFASAVSSSPRADPPSRLRLTEPLADVRHVPPVVETRRIKLAPKPAGAVAPRREATPVARRREHANGAAAADDGEAGPVALASHVEGLRLLPMRCPAADRVEIAVDGAGELHLLGRENLLRELRTTEAWAKSHRSILVMAAGHEGLKADGAPILHVFTDRPHTLADLHGSGLRLHVLAPVTVEGRAGWYAAPLNV